MVELLRDKVNTAQHAIKHLFKSNDPSGARFIEDPVYVGWLHHARTIHKASQKVGLGRKSTISFDAFITRFSGSELLNSHKEWISPLQKLGEETYRSQYPEEHLRNREKLVHDPYTTAPFSDAIFRGKVKAPGFDARVLFPAACFEPSGLIVPPQLREAFAQMGIYMHDNEFPKLWQRYDKEGAGALRTTYFFRQVGLDNFGKPKVLSARMETNKRSFSDVQVMQKNTTEHFRSKSSTEIRMAQKADRLFEPIKEKSYDEFENMTQVGQQGHVSVNSKKETVTDIKKTSASKVITQQRRVMKPHPKLDNPIDCLHYKFEEPYNSLNAGFQLFDELSDGYIGRSDFRRVLKEFGFSISVPDMDYFLSRCGLRSIQGQINYREFLSRYQSKSENSITHRIVTNQNHMFQVECHSSKKSRLSAEELEAKLVEFFHKDFIKLVSQFRSFDKYDLGVVTKTEFRSAIERRLGYQLTDKQWLQLLEEVGQEQDGLVPYQKFTKMFDIVPGSWNKKPEGPYEVTVVPKAELTAAPEIERLKERAKTMFFTPHQLPPQDNFRTIAELHQAVEDFFREKFSVFDRHYKEMDRKMTGRLSKWQFGALAKLSGMLFDESELDAIWASLDVAPDGMYSYTSLTQRFMPHMAPPRFHKPDATGVEPKTIMERDRQLQSQQEENLKERQAELLSRTSRGQAELLSRTSREKVETSVTTTKEVVREQSETKLTVTKSATFGPYSTLFASESTSLPPPPTASSLQSVRTKSLLVKVKTQVNVLSLPPPPTASSLQSVRTKSLLVKVKTQVLQNWEGLKSIFKFLDRSGAATISTTEMKEAMETMNFGLSEEEKFELCHRFDLKKNGRFHYMEFMKCFAQKTAALNQSRQMSYSKYSHKQEHKQEVARTTTVTVARALQQMRIKLMNDWRSLRRAFVKLDKNRCGTLPIQDFKRALQSCHVTITDDDFYHILSEFDHTMNGRISYDEFLTSMLSLKAPPKQFC
ncbi:hypothetical protein ScPMuIL_002162 [Solemya velum]